MRSSHFPRLLSSSWRALAFACAYLSLAGTATAATPPQRVVTLLPSLTETVCVLGACERLVGVDDFSNWPERVRALPRLGGVDDAHIEAIVALKPDLVLGPVHSRALARLRQLGLATAELEIKTVADVEIELREVARLLGLSEPRDVIGRMHAGIAEAARLVPPASRGATVYFEVDSGPYAASEISHIGELLSRIGARNVVPGRLGSVPKLNPEFVLRADPQVIMLTDGEGAGLKRRPGWARIRAVREGRICDFSSAQADVIVRPGPRMAEAARLLADCIAGHWQP